MTIRTALILSFTIGALFGAGALWVFTDSPDASEPVIALNRRPEVPSAPREVQAASLAPTSNNACEPVAYVERASGDIGSEREEVAQLKRELEKRLSALSDAMPAGHGRERAEFEVCKAALLDVTPKVARPKRLDRNREPDIGFDGEALAESGIDAMDVDWIRERWEQAKLEKLGLEDLRSRGERISPEEGYGEIEKKLRRDLGEDNYDAMLYATNQKNRVALRGVLENSAAHKAGLRSGRVVYSCDGRRIFKPMELLQCTSGGNVGEMIPVEIVANNGRTEQYWIERGPLGATEVVAVKFQPLSD